MIFLKMKSNFVADGKQWIESVGVLWNLSGKKFRLLPIKLQIKFRGLNIYWKFLWKSWDSQVRRKKSWIAKIISKSLTDFK